MSGREAAILLAVAVVLALTAAVILNLRYKPLGMVVQGSTPWVAYVDTWTGEPKFCIPTGTVGTCID